MSQNCKLCGKKEPLLNSHVFPEFLYKPMYNKYHKYYVISSDSNVSVKRANKGVYEKLFCMSCEAILGEYEDYAAKVILGDKSRKIEYVETQYGMVFKGIDYRKFKLYQISLLWRSAISTRPEIHRIAISEYHLERMREMLHLGNPGAIYEYGAALFLIPEYSKKLIDFIYPPDQIKQKIEGHTWFRALFNGLLWNFIVSRNSADFSRQYMFLGENGDLPFLNIGEKGQRFIEGLAKYLVGNRKDIM